MKVVRVRKHSHPRGMYPYTIYDVGQREKTDQIEVGLPFWDVVVSHPLPHTTEVLEEALEFAANYVRALGTLES